MPPGHSQHRRAGSPLRHLRLVTHPVRGWAAFRAWGRRSEVGLVLLAALVGGVSGLLASQMGGAAQWLHVALFGLFRNGRATRASWCGR